jgi:hypothetical protein
MLDWQSKFEDGTVFTGWFSPQTTTMCLDD